jgi:hypothetical protein
MGHEDGSPKGFQRADPGYSATPCTRICTASPVCTTKPAARQLAAVAPLMYCNVTCCPVVRLVQLPRLGVIPTTAPPTSVAVRLTGPRRRRATRSPGVTPKPAASQSHGDTGALSVTSWPVVTFSQTTVCGATPVADALSGYPSTSTS